MTAIVGPVTVNVSVGLVIPLSAAVIFEVPTATPVATPALVMVATEVVAETQVTWFVIVAVVPSE